MSRERPFVVVWREAVYSSNRLPARAKIVAHAISTFMDSAGKGARPSLETIAACAGVSPRTVAYAVNDLRPVWLRVGKRRVRPGPGGLVNTYEAVLPTWIKGHEAPRAKSDPFARQAF